MLYCPVSVPSFLKTAAFPSSTGHRPGTEHRASDGMGGGLGLLPDVTLEALVANGVLPAKEVGEGKVRQHSGRQCPRARFHTLVSSL